MEASERAARRKSAARAHRPTATSQCLTSTIRPIVFLLLWFALMLSHRLRATEALVPMPNRHTVASVPGDLVLGILVPVHERPTPKQAQTRTCGAVREQYGIQRVEAAFRTIDSINNDPNILPNITLGIEIRDSCWYSPIALEQSIEFIRNAMAASEQSQPTALAKQLTGVISNNLLPVNGASDNSSSVCAPLLRQQQLQLQQQALAGAKKVKNVVGVVGPASSTDTVQVQNLVQLFNMPQVGYSATSRDLSNKNFFKYFLRVVPSDKLQAQVMIDLMLAHNWTYVTVAYTEGSYGSSLMNAFRERALEVGICFATLESMPPNADDAKFDELIEAIEKHPNARVVICMCEGRTVGKLFSGFKRKNISNEYLVVGSDGWSDRFDVVERQEDFALGGISIRIHSAYVSDFDDYYFNLNPFTNHRNPWFAEFWESRFQCNLELPGYPSASISATSSSSSSSSSLTGNGRQQPPPPSRPAFIRPPGAKVYNRSCTGRESLRLNHKQDAKMAFVQKSIITMALGLDSMQRAICPPSKPGLCPEMLPVNGSILLQHLMNVSFSFLNEEVYFDEQGDPPGKYEILNFRRRQPDRNKDFSAWPTIGSRLPAGGLEEAVPDPYGGVSEGYPTPDGSDYSIATAVQEQRRKQDPLYDSYASLRVYHRDRSARRSERHAQARKNTSRPRRHQEQNPGYGSTSAGYEYVHVGSWKSSDGLSLFGEIQWPSKSSPVESHDDTSVSSSSPSSSGLNRQPKSVCSLPCAKGHAKKIQSDSVKCCWVCIPCHPNEYLFNEFKCRACDKGWWPNADKTGCDQIPIQYFNWRSMEAITAIGIAIFGLILTLATAVVFIRRNNTPVVKSSTRELSYMILFAMVLCYANTFFLVAKPHKITCFATRILPGFAFAMMYGALVTKTNRIARILAGSKKKIITRRPRFMSATAQVAITWIIVLIECGILVFMLIREPADRMLDYPSDDRVVLVCNTTTMGIIAPLGFDFFLIAMCTLYAFKTRNVPENFNEAKFIGFTMYTTLVIWVAFVVIYFSSEHKVTTMSLCISFSALFALFLLFFPRCYIIIFKPEKNNRSYFTTIKNIRCHIGYQIQPTNQQSGGSSGSRTRGFFFGGGGGHQDQQAPDSGSSPTPGQLAGCPAQTISGLVASGGGGGQFEPQAASRLMGCGGSLHNRKSAANCQAAQANHKHQQQGATGNENPTANNNSDLNATGDQLNGADLVGYVATLEAGKTKAAAPATTTTTTTTTMATSGRGSDFLWRHQQHHRVAAAEIDELQPIGQVEGHEEVIPSEQQQQQQQQHVPLCSAIWEAVVGLFARRSKRRESDKASSIQQHLRAIRHAENLDRQTHFRRSQVQRLAQRFDSVAAAAGADQWSREQQRRCEVGVGIERDSHRLADSSAARLTFARDPTGGVSPMPSQHRSDWSVELTGDSRPGSVNLTGHQRGRQQTLGNFATPMGASGGGQFDWLRDEEAERLLIVLSQLIGAECVWRLAKLVTRYCRASSNTPSPPPPPLQLEAEAKKGDNELAGPDSDQSVAPPAGVWRSGKNNNNNNSTEPNLLRTPADALLPPRRCYFAPLDLERSARDRKLATKLLQFLEHAARKSMLSLEPGDGGDLGSSPQPQHATPLCGLAALESLVAVRSSDAARRPPRLCAGSDRSASDSPSSTVSGSASSSSSSSVSIALGAAAAASSIPKAIAEVATPDAKWPPPSPPLMARKQKHGHAATGADTSGGGGGGALCKSEARTGEINRSTARGAETKPTTIGTAKVSGGTPTSGDGAGCGLSAPPPSSISYVGGRNHNNINNNNISEDQNYRNLCRELTVVTDDEEDPIKRALDCLRGASGGESAKPPNRQHHHATRIASSPSSQFAVATTNRSPEVASLGTSKEPTEDGDQETRITSQFKPEISGNYVCASGQPEVLATKAASAGVRGANESARSADKSTNEANAISGPRAASAADNCERSSRVTEPASEPIGARLANDVVESTKTSGCRVPPNGEPTSASCERPGDHSNKQQQQQRHSRHLRHHHHQHHRHAADHNHLGATVSVAAGRHLGSTPPASATDSQTAPTRRRPCSEERVTCRVKCCCCSRSGNLSPAVIAHSSASTTSAAAELSCARCVARRSHSTCRLCLRRKVPPPQQDSRSTSAT